MDSNARSRMPHEVHSTGAGMTLRLRQPNVAVTRDDDFVVEIRERELRSVRFYGEADEHLRVERVVQRR